MPIFISYSHKDKKFATNLAANLVANKVSIWLDEWELNAGDSVIALIEEAVQKASALIVILSKASIESVWCKKEVTAGLLRELEEKKVLVIPVLLEDCDVPLFLRDKKYADFRTDFEEGLSAVVAATAKFANPSMGRAVEGDDYFIDWAYDWGYLEDDTFALRFVIIQHSKLMPYTVLSIIQIFATKEATHLYRAHEKAGSEDFGRLVVVESFLSGLGDDEFVLRLDDNQEKIFNLTVLDPNTGCGYAGRLSSRRLGDDTGKDVLVHGRDELMKIRDMVKQSIKPPTAKQLERLQRIISRGA